MSGATSATGHVSSLRVQRDGPPIPRGAIRVLLADDHAVLRETLRLLLGSQPEIVVVGEASTGREAVDLAERLRPDVVLMDTIMPSLNGVEATRQLTRILPRTRVIMLTGYADDERILAALQAGASGYVVKSSSVDELLLAIRTVHNNNTYLSACLTGREEARDYFRQAALVKTDNGPLTPREREVLQLVAEGCANRVIAERLFISVKTVEAHKEHITTKLGLRNRADLIRYAIRKGLITVDPAEEEEKTFRKVSGA